MALIGGSNDFRGEARLSTYVYQVARITIFQRYRRENTLKRRRAASDANCEDLPDSGWSNPEFAYESKQTRTRVGRMIEGLPQAYREALRLRVLGDLTYEEIAAEMHLPVNTVSTKIHKGKKLLAALHESGRRAAAEGLCAL
jgi:RNA polymerase sigma-70 factor (ECF subfamily)